jgi:hypothetical protein
MRRRTTLTVTRYVRSALERFQNPNFERVCQLAGSFDPSWRTSLKSKISDDQKAAIDSVRANRNELAHGKSVNLTYSRVVDWYKSIIAVVNVIRGQCGLTAV